MAKETVRVKGLQELTRDFKKISKDLSKEITKGLTHAAEPVRAGAEPLALGQIRNMPRTPKWAAMKIATSSAKGTVKMFPAVKRAGGSGRPNLKGLLLERSMEPALEQNADRVRGNINDLLGNIFDDNGF
jgi:hypothetical protein